MCFNTSALVKRYHVEVGTNVVDQLFAESASTLVISRLGMVEVTSALAIKVRAGELSRADFVHVRKKFLGDIAKGPLQVARVLIGHYKHAERLVERHATSRRLRTLDALQLAIALDLHQQGHVDSFVTADRELGAVAALEKSDDGGPDGHALSLVKGVAGLGCGARNCA